MSENFNVLNNERKIISKWSKEMLADMIQIEVNTHCQQEWQQSKNGVQLVGYFDERMIVEMEDGVKVLNNDE